MAVIDLTLDEMFALEEAHPPMVGSRTGVFLEADERMGGSDDLAKRKSRIAGETSSPSQVAALVAESVGITKKQAVRTMEVLVELAYQNAKTSFTVPGFGRLVVVNRKTRTIRSSATGKPIKTPAKRVG